MQILRFLWLTPEKGSNVRICIWGSTQTPHHLINANVAVFSNCTLLQTNFRISVHRVRGNCFKEAASQRTAHYSQAIAVQVYWCAGVEQCLSAPSPPAALAQYMLTCTAQLGALTCLVRGALPDLHRRTLSALITIDVHARDIVDNLIRQAQLAHFVPFFWTLPLFPCRVTAHFYVGVNRLVTGQCKNSRVKVVSKVQAKHLTNQCMLCLKQDCCNFLPAEYTHDGQETRMSN